MNVGRQTERKGGTRYRDYILREDEHPTAGLLSFQTPYGKGKSAHPDELLFIITHQTFELWFKQIIEEILRDRSGIVARLERGEIGKATSQVRRLTRIMRVLQGQYSIIETMSPTDFLLFRDLLRPSSGYDSAQFRAIEVASGLRTDGGYLRLLTGLDLHDAGGPSGLARKVERAAAAAERGRPAPLKGYSIVKKLAAARDANGLRTLARALSRDSLRDAAYKTILDAKIADPGWKKSLVKSWTEGRVREWEELQAQEHHAGGGREWGMDGKKAAEVQRRVVAVYHRVTHDEVAGPEHELMELLEAFIEYDEVFRNFRTIHINMVLRVIGAKPGTAGSTGARYLGTTLGYTFFPLLWRARDHMEGPEGL